LQFDSSSERHLEEPVWQRRNGGAVATGTVGETVLSPRFTSQQEKVYAACRRDRTQMIAIHEVYQSTGKSIHGL